MSLALQRNVPPAMCNPFQCPLKVVYWQSPLMGNQVFLRKKHSQLVEVQKGKLTVKLVWVVDFQLLSPAVSKIQCHIVSLKNLSQKHSILLSDFTCRSKAKNLQTLAIFFLQTPKYQDPYHANKHTIVACYVLKTNTSHQDHLLIISLQYNTHVKYIAKYNSL
jgi:hypothetical protein